MKNSKRGEWWNCLVKIGEIYFWVPSTYLTNFIFSGRHLNSTKNIRCEYQRLTSRLRGASGKISLSNFEKSIFVYLRKECKIPWTWLMEACAIQLVSFLLKKYLIGQVAVLIFVPSQFIVMLVTRQLFLMREYFFVVWKFTIFLQLQSAILPSSVCMKQIFKLMNFLIFAILDR